MLTIWDFWNGPKMNGNLKKMVVKNKKRLGKCLNHRVIQINLYACGTLHILACLIAKLKGIFKHHFKYNSFIRKWYT